MRSAQKGSILQDWKVLDDVAQLEQIIEDSHEKPVVLFKHSVSCGISSMIKHQLESSWEFDAAKLDFYYLDLLAHRPISNQIAEQFGVVHQSPQIIVIRNGHATFDTSHHAINNEKIRAAID